jgi:hypothetical protein
MYTHIERPSFKSRLSRPAHAPHSFSDRELRPFPGFASPNSLVLPLLNFAFGWKEPREPARKNERDKARSRGLGSEISDVLLDPRVCGSGASHLSRGLIL